MDHALGADQPILLGTRPSHILAPPFDWTGLYVGINGGGEWGKSTQTQLGGPILNPADFHVSGGHVGGTLGFNMQIDWMVIGLEGDLDWASIGGSSPCPSPGFTCSIHSDYVGTIRGRVGYTWLGWMPYATAGAALGDLKESFSPSIGTLIGTTTNRVGWTAGGGVQYAFDRSRSAKVEFLYVNFGTFTCGVACTGIATRSLDITLTEEIARFGINYRF